MKGGKVKKGSVDRVAKERKTKTTKTRLTKAARQKKEIRVSFFKDLLHRRVPQILGIYFVGHLGIVIFMESLVQNHPLSPHLPEFCLVALASIIPTILLLAYFHGRTGRYQWGRVEKIGVPVNLLVSAVLLFVLFQGKDLGATTKTVTFTDEEGQTIERKILKSEFRKKSHLFFFENESGDSTLNWLQYGIPYALEIDLEQDLYLETSSWFVEKMKEVGFPEGIGLPLTLRMKIAVEQHQDYFISGSFANNNEVFSVKTLLYETRRGKLLEKRTFTGEDIFQLIDEMSVQLKRDLEIPDYHIEEVKDLPVSEILTNSMPAFRMYSIADYEIWHNNDYEAAVKHLENAIKKDSTFAYAYDELHYNYQALNQSEKAERALLGAMQYKDKLTERAQFIIKYDYFAMNEDTGKQFALSKMWVELYPDDIEAHQLLASDYSYRNQWDEVISEYERILELDPKQYDYFQDIGRVYEIKRKFKEALKYYKQYADQFPNDYKSFTRIGESYEGMAEYEQAKVFYERALIIEPGEISILTALAGIEVQLGNFDQALEQYQYALKISKTTNHRIQVYMALNSFYEFRGQIGKSIEYYNLESAEAENVWAPVNVLMRKVNLINKYLKVGKKDVAFQILQTLEAKLVPPFDKFLPLFYFRFYIELEDVDNAEKLLGKIEPTTQSSYLSVYPIFFDAFIIYGQGKIHEIRGECEQAIQSYQKRLEIGPWTTSINVDVGRCYRNLREFEKAEEFILKALKIHPFDPKAHYEIALVYWDMGKKEKAMEHLKKALYVWEEADPEYKPAKKARDKLAEWESSNL